MEKSISNDLNSVSSLKYTTSLVDILHYRTISEPNKLAYMFLVDGETEKVSLTYQQLNEKALAIAVQLKTLKATSKRALLIYPPGLEFITAFFGCLYAEVVAVPMRIPRRNQRMTQLQAIVKDSQATFALTIKSVFTNIEKSFSEEPELAAIQIIATDDITTNLDLDWQTPKLSKSTPAFLQYTSGSTGIPKGVIVTHGNIIHNQQLIHKAFGHSEQSIVVGWLPLFHDMGLIGHVLQPIYVGFPSILMSPVAFLQKPILWLKAISKYRATTSGGPNFAYDLCLKKIQLEQFAELDLSSWDLAFNGAEPIRAETLKQFGEKFASCGFKYISFYPCYGMAETTLFTTGGDKNQLPVIKSVLARELEQNRVIETGISSPLSRDLVSVGCPRMNTTVVIVNPDSLTRSQEGFVGEIWISSESVASGYWNCPQNTQETFQAYLNDTGDGPFLRTGDLGFFSNGELFVTGRLKDVIIIRGRNYYPQDIEVSVSKSHPALLLNSGAAFSVEIEGEEKLIIAQEIDQVYVSQLKSDEIVEAINQAVYLEYELAINTIVLLKPKSIPKTSSGKIQRHACRQKFLNGSLENVVFTKSAHKVTTKVTLEKNLSIANSDELRKSRANDIETIDDLEQTLVEKDYELDKLLCKSNVAVTENSKGKIKKVQSDTNQKSKAESIQTWLINWLSQKLKLPQSSFDRQKSFAEYGIDSVIAVELAQDLQEWLNYTHTIEATITWNFPNIESLSHHLADESAKKSEKVNQLLEKSLIKETSDFEALSEAEIAKLLAAEIAAAKGRAKL